MRKKSPMQPETTIAFPAGLQRLAFTTLSTETLSHHAKNESDTLQNVDACVYAKTTEKPGNGLKNATVKTKNQVLKPLYAKQKSTFR